MKIDIISNDGLHPTEKIALQQIRTTFNSSKFSQEWFGFAGFMFVSAKNGDREIDLLLATHDRLILIEFKHWHGIVEANGNSWFQNGDSRGRSAVLVLADKKKVLSAKLKSSPYPYLGELWIDYRVVMSGDADFSAIPDDEKHYILTLEQFLGAISKNGYQKIFGEPRMFKPLVHKANLTEFIRGKEFKPTEFSFNNFRIVGDASFVHPRNFYREYKSVKKDDKAHEALMRRWDFDAFEGLADTPEDRSAIVLREHRVLGHLNQEDEELSQVVLQPQSHATKPDVIAGFCELYKLPPRQLRLDEFVNRNGEALTIGDRLDHVKVLLSHFARVHRAGVAHRDIGSHSLWLERPAKVSISSFISAYFPSDGTVGSIRPLLRAGEVSIPEDTELANDEVSDPFRRDVYLLGIAAHYLLYLTPPRKDDGLAVWETHLSDPYQGVLDNWLARALNWVPRERFATAQDMLNALSEISFGDKMPAGVDLSAFECFRTEDNPIIKYPIGEQIQSIPCHTYKSVDAAGTCLVKIWYGKLPDIKRTEESLLLQDFLEKTRLVKAQQSEILPEIVEFGIAAPGAFIVQRWHPGETLKTICSTSIEMDVALQLCLSLVKATQHLHGMGLVHGDLHPGNVLIADGTVRFIDIVDLVTGTTPPYNPAYVPIDYEGVSLEQRDCYAVAKICKEIIDTAGTERPHELFELLDEIQSCLQRNYDVYDLTRIQDALNTLTAPPAEKTCPYIQVPFQSITSAQPLLSDDGELRVLVKALKASRNNPDVVLITVLGVIERLELRLKPEDLSLGDIRRQRVQHSEYVQQCDKACGSIHMAIELVPATVSDVKSLVAELSTVSAIKEEIEAAQGALLGLDNDVEPETGLTETGVTEQQPQTPLPSPATAAIWEAILEAEESTLPEVEIAGPVEKEEGGNVRFAYNIEGEPLDYDSNDKVEALQEINGEYLRIGQLNVRETTQLILVLDTPYLRMQRDIGTKIKFRSQQDLSSFRRRQKAVTRILQRESVISNLVDYFDPRICPVPQVLAEEPTDEELDAYNRYNAEGELEFSLNELQRKAFRTLWTRGPVSLLQGPPGTGKTAFIASFIHFAFSKGARSILLSSQSHEAVNNAVEKVLELSEHHEQNLDIVRFGAEGMVSPPLRPYHSDAILQKHRELFRAEMRQRVEMLSSSLGLAKGFVRNWFDLDLDLGRLLRDIERMTGQREALKGKDENRLAIEESIRRRTETFLTIAHVKYGNREEGEPALILSTLQDRLRHRHGVSSLDAVSRLNQVIGMAYEWVDRLGARNGNFEEFLAKTRSLVCGTCVGLGRSQFGVANNRYDWVIVDEAARATPGELAVAIQSGARILLVGDHLQLPPLFTRELIDEITVKLSWHEPSVLSRSDFERAFESNYGHQVGATLQTQYRMAPAIGSIVSECFYPVPLAPGRGNPKSWFDSLPDRLQSIVTWIDTSKSKPDAYERKSPKRKNAYENLFEVNQILDLLRDIFAAEGFVERLLSETKDGEVPVGVICTYREQKNLLAQKLSEQDWARGVRQFIKVDTVDSYQGKENRIIILSLTRYNKKQYEGFLSSPERTNVAISRAMDRLVIVGAADMWRSRNKKSPLGKVLSFIEQHRDGTNYQIIDANSTSKRQK
ncbi:AAA domain-containing protein [Chromobacterium haemolyticum]|uniref:AAA domain-containing protein n=1 Tax=Chromobacterium haemolyticum TaxID=394935 RepID=UPI000DEF39A9|nr:AAA domain-containing protein [Chromobacterium haemolyticum]